MKRNLLSMSVAASSYGDDDDEKFASHAKELLHDADDARSDDAGMDPVSRVAHPLPFAALQSVLGRFQSVFRLIQTGGVLTDPLGATPPSTSFHLRSSTRDKEALLSESDAFCTAMSAGVFGIALADLSGNLVFMSAFWSWLTAQTMKYVTAFYREGRWDWQVMFDSGGMPSSHTSGCWSHYRNSVSVRTWFHAVPA